mmetsp:Transcript_28214/g.45415  ORF Transcript_28214/g.45415 Transcript_28214/m.45415 type:complete len:413 (-) Transcript_28214:243-1481(-)
MIPCSRFMNTRLQLSCILFLYTLMVAVDRIQPNSSPPSTLLSEVLESLPGGEESITGEQSPTVQRVNLAYLISGQEHRFVYRDSLGRMAQSRAFDYMFNVSDVEPSYIAKGSKGIIDIDVFIILQRGKKFAKRFTGPEIQPPPYGLTKAEITSFFISQGARRVEITYINGSIVENEFQRSQTGLIEKHGSEWWKDRVEKSVRRDGRNPLRGTYAMLLLRHLAHKMALESEARRSIEYQAFLVSREDNIYFSNLKRGHHGRILTENLAIFFADHDGEKRVVMDSVCGNGGLSDKIFIANKKAAEVLLGANRSDFEANVELFLKGNSSSELFYGAAIGGDHTKLGPKYGDFSSTVAPFFRIDTRYVLDRKRPNGLRLCIPRQYWHCVFRLPFGKREESVRIRKETLSDMNLTLC